MSEQGQTERKCVVETAQVWFDGARGASPSASMASRLGYMENAFNHTENALVAARAELTSLRASQAALVEALNVARQWMPERPEHPSAVADCAVVDAALAQSQERTSMGEK